MDTNQSRQDINDKNSFYNQFEICFILKIPHQKNFIQLQFPGVSGKQFYKLIKQGSIQWKKFPNPVFSRLDIVYQRASKSNDPISSIEFRNSACLQFQELNFSKNLVSEKNQKGLILKIGNRRSSNHYRIYTDPKNKNNILRFEAEMKGNLIKDFQDLLITSSFDEHRFESRIAYQFFKYFFELFTPLNQSSHIDWLVTRLRPYQSRNTFSSELVLHSDYLTQIDYKLLKEKQHLIILLRLLAYVKRLNYVTKSLKSPFRQYKFPLRDFLNYNNLNPNSYQVNKLKNFFELVKTNFVIESFSQDHYQMFVTIPEVEIDKSKQNISMVEIWIAEELFHYLHPFLFTDIFQQNPNKHQFQVLFEIIKTSSSIDIRKEFNITQFLNNSPSVLSNQHKRQIQEYFIQYLKVLHQEGKLQDKVLDLSSNN